MLRENLASLRNELNQLQEDRNDVYAKFVELESKTFEDRESCSE